MSTWKATTADASRAAQGKPAIPAASRRPPARVDVVSLRIDADEDRGSDPYNHTGQFCKSEFDEHSDQGA
jgi:hypothetical protein